MRIEEAKNLWCPDRRAAIEVRDSKGVTHVASVNYHPGSEALFKCLGPGCSAWVKTGETAGYCGRNQAYDTDQELPTFFAE